MPYLYLFPMKFCSGLTHKGVLPPDLTFPSYLYTSRHSNAGLLVPTYVKDMLSKSAHLENKRHDMGHGVHEGLATPNITVIRDSVP